MRKERPDKEAQVTKPPHSFELSMSVVLITLQLSPFRTACVTFNGLNGINGFWAFGENKLSIFLSRLTDHLNFKVGSKS